MKHNKDKNKGNKRIAAVALSVAVVGSAAANPTLAAGTELENILRWSSGLESLWNRRVSIKEALDASGGAVNIPQPSVSPSQAPDPEASVTPVPSVNPSGMPFSSAEPEESSSPAATPDVPTMSDSPMRPIVSEDTPATKMPIPSAGVVEPTDKAPGTIESKEPVCSKVPMVSGEPATSKPDNSGKPDETQAPDISPTASLAPGDWSDATTMPMPTKLPDGYMAGDPGFIPGIFQDTHKKEPSNGSTSGGHTYWGSYSTVYSSNNQVVLPGILSDVLQIEKETSLKQSENVRWGDARTKKLNAVTKSAKAQETIPGTDDFTSVEWVFPAMAGSIAVFAACCQRKREDTE